jgi:hypothetical protein
VKIQADIRDSMRITSYPNFRTLARMNFSGRRSILSAEEALAEMDIHILMTDYGKPERLPCRMA